MQPQKIVRGLKFQLSKVERLYYLCSENKGADHLCVYRTADLHLCFSICKKPVFSVEGNHKKGLAKVSTRTADVYLMLVNVFCFFLHKTYGGAVA